VSAVLGWSSVAVGGSTPDPNIGDTVLGTGHGLRYTSDGDTLDQGNDGYAHPFVGCGPAKRHVVGGGFTLKGPPAGSQRIGLESPLDYTDSDMKRDDGWAVSGYGSTTGALTAISICEKGTTPTYRHIAPPPSSNPVRSDTVSCHAGDGHVVGGGVAISTAFSFISASHPTDGADADNRPDDGWSGRVLDQIGGGGGFDLTAICQPGAVSYPTRETEVGTGQGGTALASCPHGTHISSGGGKITGPGAEVHLEDSYPVDGAHWKTVAFNSSPSKQTLTAYAVCLG